jgi:hypothetical protein
MKAAPMRVKPAPPPAKGMPPARPAPAGTPKLRRLLKKLLA